MLLSAPAGLPPPRRLGMSHRALRVAAVAFCALALCGLLTRDAGAQQYDWINASGGTYSTPSNWSPVGPPTSMSTARFNLATNYNVTWTASASVDAISVNNGSVTWNMGGFTY